MANQLKFQHDIPLISIIVLNYNGKQSIGVCLESLLDTHYENLEIIFLDNKSSDGSLELVQKNFGNDPRLRVIKNKVNSGFAAGNNTAAKYAKGQYLVFLNSDTEVDPNWLRELVKVMELDPTLGAAQSKLLQADRKYYDSAGDFMCQWGLTIKRGAGEEDKGQYDHIEDIFSARGAAMIVRREVFRKIGMFDPTFFLQLEDLDLCWRIRLAGYGIVFIPKSVVYHKSRVAFDRIPQDFTVFLSQRNRLLMVLKNYGLMSLLKYFPITLMLTLFGFLFENGSIQCRIKALIWVIVNFDKVWAERLRVQNCTRTVQDIQILEHMLWIDPISLSRRAKVSTRLNNEPICFGV